MKLTRRGMVLGMIATPMIIKAEVLEYVPRKLILPDDPTRLYMRGSFVTTQRYQPGDTFLHGDALREATVLYQTGPRRGVFRTTYTVTL